MQSMTLTEIVSAVKGVWWNPGDQIPTVSAVSTDSRKITPGCLFLPWVGEKFDGHQFIDAALDAGAAGCLCAKLPQNNFISRWRTPGLPCGIWRPLTGIGSGSPLCRSPAAWEKLPRKR